MKKSTIFNQRSLKKLVRATFSVVASLALFASCGEEETTNPDKGGSTGDDDDEVVTTFVEATRPDWHASWAMGDKMGVINSGGVIPFSFETGVKFAGADLKATDAAEILYAFYPYGPDLAYVASEDGSKMTYTYTLPTYADDNTVAQELTYNSNGSIDMAALRGSGFMCGATTTKVASDVEGAIDMVMHNVTSTIRLQLTGLIPESEVGEVIVESLDGKTLSPRFSNISISKENGAFVAVQSSEALPPEGRADVVPAAPMTNKIVINVNGGKTSRDGALDVYMSVLPQTMVVGTTWNVRVYGKGGVGQLGQTVTVTVPTTITTVAAGQSYAIPVVIQGYAQLTFNDLSASRSLKVALGEQDIAQISHLTLIGDVTEADMIYTRSFSNLQYLNLWETTITSIPDYLYAGIIDTENNPHNFEIDPPASLTIREFHFPEGMTEINGYIFYDCNALKKVVLPKRVKKLGESLFRECRLTECDLPSSLEIIGGWVFDEARIPNLVIPASVIEIGSGAFAQFKPWNGVETVTFLNPDPSTITFKGNETYLFESMNADPAANTIRIRVPAASLEAYKTTSHIKKWAALVIAIEE